MFKLGMQNHKSFQIVLYSNRNRHCQFVHPVNHIHKKVIFIYLSLRTMNLFTMHYIRVDNMTNRQGKNIKTALIFKLYKNICTLECSVLLKKREKLNLGKFKTKGHLKADPTTVC